MESVRINLIHLPLVQLSNICSEGTKLRSGDKVRRAIQITPLRKFHTFISLDILSLYFMCLLHLYGSLRLWLSLNESK